MIGIYKITNKLNNKSYIGQSKNVLKRLEEHKENLQYSNNTWYPEARAESNSINDFTFEIIKQCSIEELDKYESYYIELYNSFFKGYNRTYDGQYGKINIIVTFDLRPMLKIENISLYQPLMSQNAYKVWNYYFERKKEKTFIYAPTFAAKHLKISVNDYLIALDELIENNFIEETLDGFIMKP